MQNFVNDVRANYSAGNFNKSLEILQTSLKHYHLLSEEDQSFVVGMLINHDQKDRVLSILSKDINDTASQKNQWYYKKLAHCAHLKVSVHSFTAAENNLNEIINVIKKNQIPFDQEVLRFILSHAATILRILNRPQAILDLEKLYPYPAQLVPRDYFFKLEIERAKIVINNQVDKKVLQEIEIMPAIFPKNSTFGIVVLMHLLDIKINSLLFSENINPDQYIDPNKIPPTHLPHYFYLHGKLKLINNEKDHAYDYFSRALASANSLEIKQSILYYLDKIRPGSISLMDSILLKCTPAVSQESFLSGNRFLKKLPSPSPFYEKDLKESPSPQTNDCWIISNKSIQLQNYQKIELNEKTIDLYSGIIINGKDVVLLSELRTNLVRHIVSFGTNGAHQSYLIDVIFGGTFLYLESAKLRLKNLIVEMNKIGVKFYRKNNSYYFDFEKNSHLIIYPSHHNYIGPISFLSKFNQSISRRVIETSLQIKPSTASLYIKKWKDMGLIEKDPNQEYGTYIFTNKGPIVNHSK